MVTDALVACALHLAVAGASQFASPDKGRVDRKEIHWAALGTQDDAARHDAANSPNSPRLICRSRTTKTKHAAQT